MIYGVTGSSLSDCLQLILYMSPVTNVMLIIPSGIIALNENCLKTRTKKISPTLITQG